MQEAIRNTYSRVCNNSTQHLQHRYPYRREVSELRDEDLERRRSGLRRLRSRSLDREESEPESESDCDEESESESSLELESEPDDEPESEDVLLALFFDGPPPLSFICFSRSFSFVSNILLAVPLLFLNSSGASTDGFPSALSLANSRGFSSCCVRDGRET